MNWYIGQEVVCVKTHSQGVVKEGQHFVIDGLRSSPCKCRKVLINVGKVAHKQHKECRLCGMDYFVGDNIYWLSEHLFAPLMDITELKEILNEETINK